MGGAQGGKRNIMELCFNHKVLACLLFGNPGRAGFLLASL